MKIKAILVSLLIITAMITFGQRPTMELTFAAENNGLYVRLDSIKIMNRKQGGDTVLYWPDTVLTIYYVGLPEISNNENAFKVFQNYPNPVTDQTTISFFVPEKDNVSMIITDMLGRMVLKYERVLDKGIHSFRFTPGSDNLYFFTARWQGQTSSIKILQAGLNSGGMSSLEYIGIEGSSPQLKASKNVQIFRFSIGDVLLFIGYAGALESGTLDSPVNSEIYTFQFATNIPCQNTPAVEYEGQVYNTIQIFSQCWLKENLNVGTIIPGTMEQSNNGTIEKYCYNNETDSCAKYGGLYQWDEMMQYTDQQGVQGICPPGWHLPADEEWKVLEGAVDSQYGIGDPEWDNSGWSRGFDAGKNLKTTSGWNDGGNGTDLYGFSGLPGGSRNVSGGFRDVGGYGDWWASSQVSSYVAWSRDIGYVDLVVNRVDGDRRFGFSVRCLRDEVDINPIELTFTAVNNTSHVRLEE